MSFSSRRRVCLTAAALLAMSQAGAQQDLPPNAEPGKCYARCFIPATSETYTEEVEATPAVTRMVKSPGVYETVTEQVLVREAYKKLVPVPAVMETVTEQVLVKEESKSTTVVPATYDWESDVIEVEPAATRWERTKSNNCVSNNPDDCVVMCLVNVPAKSKTVRRQVLKTPATTRDTIIPAVYKPLSKQVVKEPATVREVDVPAQYATIKRTVQREGPSVREVTVPATYTTVTRRRTVGASTYTSWEEVLCERDVTRSKVRQIQDALRVAGYDPGPSDNVLGARTQEALKRYQTDKGLPVGGLNTATMKSLGVN